MQTTWSLSKKAAALAILTIGAVLADGGRPAAAQVPATTSYETVYVPARYKLKVNGRRAARGVTLVPAGVAPTVVASPVAVTETRYVPAVPVVTSRVAVPRTVVTRTYVPAVPFVETRYVQPLPVIERVVPLPY